MKKSIELIALDLDGTLLNEKGVIPFDNLTAIKKVQAQCPNIKIVITTGTGPGRSMEHAKELGIDKDGYMICYNGGAIIRVLNGKIKVLAKKALSLAKCLDVIKFAKAFEAKDLQIYDLDHKRVLGIENIENIYQTKLETNQEQNNQEDFLYKGLLIFTSTDEEINSIIEKLTKDYTELQITRSKLSRTHPFFKLNSHGIGIEVNNAGANKGEALKTLGEILNIKPEQVLACGDEMNDETMIKFAGYSVAMEHGNPNLIRIAKFTAPGVAKAIETHIFSQEQMDLRKQEQKEFYTLAETFDLDWLFKIPEETENNYWTRI